MRIDIYMDLVWLWNTSSHTQIYGAAL